VSVKGEFETAWGTGKNTQQEILLCISQGIRCFIFAINKMDTIPAAQAQERFEVLLFFFLVVFFFLSPFFLPLLWCFSEEVVLLRSCLKSGESVFVCTKSFSLSSFSSNRSYPMFIRHLSE
jgi:hypothetical protein